VPYQNENVGSEGEWGKETLKGPISTMGTRRTSRCGDSGAKKGTRSLLENRGGKKKKLTEKGVGLKKKSPRNLVQRGVFGKKGLKKDQRRRVQRSQRGGGTHCSKTRG